MQVVSAAVDMGGNMTQRTGLVPENPDGSGVGGLAEIQVCWGDTSPCATSGYDYVARGTPVVLLASPSRGSTVNAVRVELFVQGFPAAAGVAVRMGPVQVSGGSHLEMRAQMHTLAHTFESILTCAAPVEKPHDAVCCAGHCGEH